MRLATNGAAERLKIGYAAFILNDPLTVEDRVSYWQLGDGIRDRTVTLGPIVAVPRECASFAIIDNEFSAVAVVLISCAQPSPCGGLATSVGIMGLMKVSSRTRTLTRDAANRSKGLNCAYLVA